jgi:hypothetical protein
MFIFVNLTSGVVMQFNKLLLALGLIAGLIGVGYADNHTADVINAAANFMNALNGQQVSGSYAQQRAITAGDMARVCRGQDVRYYDDCVAVVVYPIEVRINDLQL